MLMRGMQSMFTIFVVTVAFLHPQDVYSSHAYESVNKYFGAYFCCVANRQNINMIPHLIQPMWARLLHRLRLPQRLRAVQVRRLRHVPRGQRVRGGGGKVREIIQRQLQDGRVEELLR